MNRSSQGNMRRFGKAVLFGGLIGFSMLVAQDKETVAVLDFEGRGISQMEAQTLTDRFSSELARTDAMIQVERNQMNSILKEQGFQQSGCTSGECAAEVGALLGVQHMIAGAFGKIGNSYTIDAKLFSVETGKLEKTVSRTYKGEIDGLIKEVEGLAWELVGLPPPNQIAEGKIPAEEPESVKPKRSRKWLFYTGLIAVAGGGAYYYWTTLAEEPVQSLGLPPDPPARLRSVRGGSR